METIIMWATLGLMFFFMLISALIGLGRGLKKTVGSSVVIAVSAIIALIVTACFFRPAPDKQGFITELIMPLLGSSELSEILQMPSVTDLINYYVSMIAAPFIFVLLFVVIRFVLGIAMRICMKFIPLMNHVPKVAKRLGGLGVGLVNGFILFAILFMPLFGTVDIINNAVTEISAITQESEQEGAGDSLEYPKYENLEAVITDGYIEDQPYDEGESSSGSDDLAEVKSYLDAVTNQGAGKITLTFGGRLMYNTLTSARYYGEKVVLKNEINVIIGIVSGLSSADDSALVGIVDVIVDGTERSPLIRGCAADILSTAAGKWANGEAFMGIEMPEAGEYIDPILDTMFEILAAESRETVVEDMKSISAFLHALDKHGLFNMSDEERGGLLELLADKGAFSEIIGTIADNPRMTPVIDRLNRVCIMIFADDLGFFTDDEAIYESLMNELGVALEDYTSSYADREQTKDKIKDILVKHGIDVTDEGFDSLADALLDEFKYVNGTNEELSAHVQEFFMLYAAVAADKVSVNSDGTITADGVALNCYFGSTYTSSKAYALAAAGVSIDNAGTLSSPEAMETYIMTTDKILEELGVFGNIADKNGEITALDSVMSTMIDSFMEIGGDSLHAADLMAQMGIVLDKMSETQTYGATIPHFLVAIMQSPKISDSIGLNAKEMTDFANKINNGNSDGTGYAQIAGTVSKTFDVLEAMNNSSEGADTRDKVTVLMKDLTPETAKVMQEITSPSLMVNYGVDDSKAEQSADAVGKLFGHMANYTQEHPQNNMADAEYDEKISKEADAVNTIIDLSIKANNSDEHTSVFNHGNNEGTLEMDAYSVVELFATSQVASDTITDLVGSGDEKNADPMGIGDALTDDDRVQLTEALDEYAENNADVENIDEIVENIGILFGM